MPELELARSPDDRKAFVLEGVGELRDSGWRSRSATVTATDGRAWTVDRKGWRSRIVISDAAGGEPATFQAAGTFRRGGRLKAGDDAYELRPSSRWKERYALIQEGRELATLEAARRRGKRPLRVEVHDAPIDDLVLLTTCCLVKQFADHAAAEAAAAGI